jgi:hypothetical protein
MPETSKGRVQTKRDTLALQVGGWAWGSQPHPVKRMLFRNLTTSLGETGCQGGQGSPRAVAPNEEEEEFIKVNEDNTWEDIENIRLTRCYEHDKFQCNLSSFSLENSRRVTVNVLVTLLTEAIRSSKNVGSYMSHVVSHPRRRHSSLSPS